MHSLPYFGRRFLSIRSHAYFPALELEVELAPKPELLPALPAAEVEFAPLAVVA